MGIDSRIKDGKGRGNTAGVDSDNRLLVSASGIPPKDSTDNLRVYRQYFTLDGTATGNKDMNVDGSITEQVFYITADGKYDRYIDSMSFLIADVGASLREFGGQPRLTVGIEVVYEDTISGSVVIHESLKSNFDVVRLCGGSPAFGTGTASFQAPNVIGSSEAYIPILDFSGVFGMPWGVKLPGGTNLKLKIIIKDNLSGIDFMDVIAYGYDVI